MPRFLVEYGTPRRPAIGNPCAFASAGRQWYARKTRVIAGLAAATAYFRSSIRADARALLPAIHVPTLILHRSGYHLVGVEHGRYLAEQIEGARLVELPGSDGPPTRAPTSRSKRSRSS